MAAAKSDKAATVIDPTFNAADADLALVCTEPNTDGGHSLHIFKVHKRVLATPSTFFESMMEASSGESAGSEDLLEAGLPKLNMEESVEVTQVLLGAAYNMPTLLAKILKTRDWKFALDVWEASNKYTFYVLKGLSSVVIQSLAPVIKDEDSLKIFTRASMFDDQELAGIFLEKAARIPPHRIKLEILHQLPALAIKVLLLRQMERIKNDVDALATSSSALRCTACASPLSWCLQKSEVLDRVAAFKHKHFA